MHRRTPRASTKEEILELIKEKGYAHFEATIISKGRITIPIAIRKALGVKEGDEIHVIIWKPQDASCGGLARAYPQDRGKKIGLGRKNR